MPPTPSPAPIDVFVHSGPAEWWQVVAALGPLTVLVGAFLAAFMAWRTLRQKAVADNRAEWWRRTQWALDHALDTDENTKALGLVTLDVLAHSELARKGELELLDIAWKAVTSDDNGVAKDGIEDGGPVAKEDALTTAGTFFSVEVRGRRKPKPPRIIYQNAVHGPGYSGPRPVGDKPSPATDPVDSGKNMGDNGPTDNNQTEEG